MEAKIHDNSSVANEKIAGKHSTSRDKDKEDNRFSENEESKSSEFGKSNKDIPNGFTNHANIISTLNEDKSTISDESAPSASMQDKEKNKAGE